MHLEGGDASIIRSRPAPSPDFLMRGDFTDGQEGDGPVPTSILIARDRKSI